MEFWAKKTEHERPRIDTDIQVQSLERTFLCSSSFASQFCQRPRKLRVALEVAAPEIRDAKQAKLVQQQVCRFDVSVDKIQRVHECGQCRRELETGSLAAEGLQSGVWPEQGRYRLVIKGFQIRAPCE